MDKIKFNVIYYDVNHKRFVAYDVLPYLRECYLNEKKNDRPRDMAAMREFVVKQSSYMWWSRSEYELILKPWICDDDKERKIDIHWQLMLNLGIISQLLLNEFSRKRKKK